MTDGRAGFFTLEEVRSSGGIVLTDEDQRPTAGRRPDDWSDLTSMRSVEAYDDRALNALRDGDLARAGEVQGRGHDPDVHRDLPLLAGREGWSGPPE